jgi:hypothetical protein
LQGVRCFLTERFTPLLHLCAQAVS